MGELIDRLTDNGVHKCWEKGWNVCGEGGGKFLDCIILHRKFDVCFYKVLYVYCLIVHSLSIRL